MNWANPMKPIDSRMVLVYELLPPQKRRRMKAEAKESKNAGLGN